MINWFLSLFYEKIHKSDLWFYKGHKDSVEDWETEHTPVLEVLMVGKRKVKAMLYKVLRDYRENKNGETTLLDKKFLHGHYEKLNQFRVKSKEVGFKEQLQKMLDESDK